MSLRKQLNTALPLILPANPKDAIKGTELIRLIRLRIEGNYSDASLRYHFSIMSCDPGSPIAKVEKGQGYYRRTAPVPVLSSAKEILSLSQGRLDDIGEDREVIDIALMRVKKFRAIVHRWAESNGKQPFIFREPFQANAPIGNLWKFPEMVLVDWEGGMNQFEADPLFQLKQTLQLPPFRLSASRLYIQAGLHSFREDFFQALSSSEWANAGEVYYAEPIQDEALALNAHPRETEALMERLEINRIASPVQRDHIDWTALDAIRNDSEEIDKLFNWLIAGTQSKNPQAYQED